MGTCTLRTPVTARGSYLKKMMERKELSQRSLAKLLAEARVGEPLDGDDKRVAARRRTVSRYFAKTGAHDVDDDMIKELSPLLGITVESWPPKRPSAVVRLRAEVARLESEAKRKTVSQLRRVPAAKRPRRDQGKG